jgi:hypothetical protein
MLADAVENEGEKKKIALRLRDTPHIIAMSHSNPRATFLGSYLRPRAVHTYSDASQVRSIKR